MGMTTRGELTLHLFIRHYLAPPGPARLQALTRTTSTRPSPTPSMDATDPLRLLTSASLLVGGVLATAGWVWLGFADPGRTGEATGWYVVNTMIMVGGGLIAIGLPAIHAAQSRHAGVLGAIGIVVLVAGVMTAYLAVQGIEMINYGLPRNAIPITYVALPALAIGAVLTAVVSLQSGVVPAILPVALLIAVGLGALTLIPDLPARANTWMGTLFTATLAVWGMWLLTRLGSG
jgi:hypothetical protein